MGAACTAVAAARLRRLPKQRMERQLTATPMAMLKVTNKTLARRTKSLQKRKKTDFALCRPLLKSCCRHCDINFVQIVIPQIAASMVMSPSSDHGSTETFA